MKTFSSLAVAGLICISTPVLATETYEGSYSASSENQMQSCNDAQNQAERVVKEHFRRLTSSGSTVSVDGKRCECSRNSRYATPLFDCIGYVTGTVEERAAFDDKNCVSILTSSTDQSTWGFRMSKYLTCVRRLPDYNRSWDAAAMSRVRQQQQSEGGG